MSDRSTDPPAQPPTLNYAGPAPTTSRSVKLTIFAGCGGATAVVAGVIGLVLCDVIIGGLGVRPRLAAGVLGFALLASGLAAGRRLVIRLDRSGAGAMPLLRSGHLGVLLAMTLVCGALSVLCFWIVVWGP